MAQDARYLPRWQVAAVIAGAILLVPMYEVYTELQAQQPRIALALFTAGYAIVIGLVGFLAWSAWSMVVGSYRLHSSAASRTFGARIKVLFREPWSLYFACVLTVGTLGAIIHLFREVLRRSI
jgi:uncharacterized membrane protein YcfT